MKSYLLNLFIIPYLISNCVGISLKLNLNKNLDDENEHLENLNKNPRAAVLEDKRFASFIDIGSTVYYQSLCLITEMTQIKMQCPGNDKLKILRSLYGFNPNYKYQNSAKNLESCAFSIKDCNFDKEYSIDNDCTGKNSCIMTIRKSRVINESQVYFQTCKDFNYVQINYQCLPNLPTKDICGVVQSELSHAYIMTPSKLIANSNCECTLTSNYENGQILLRRVDMKLPNEVENQNCHSAYLEILENDKGIDKKCGFVREPGSIFGSGAKNLKLNFVTHDLPSSYDYGFWLEVLASPPRENHNIEIKCNNKRKDFVYAPDNNDNKENSLEGILSKGEIQNSEIYKKLKQIQDKIKRLNKTFLDPKLSKYHNRTLTFLNKSSKKLNNVSNSIAELGKKLFQENINLLAKNQDINEKEINKNLNNLNINIENIKKLKESESESKLKEIKQPIVNKQSLDEEIGEFLLNGKESIGQEIDEIEKVDNKIDLIKNKLKEKDNKLDLKQQKSKVDKDKSKQIILSNKQSKQDKDINKKIELKNPNSKLKELNLADNENIKVKPSLPKKQSKTTTLDILNSEEDWLKTLESLNEELDLSEKIISSKEIELSEPVTPSSPISANKLLEELTGEKGNYQDLVHQPKSDLASSILSSAASVNNQKSNNYQPGSVNAQMQHLSNNVEHQSNSTDSFTQTTKHQLFKRNTIHQQKQNRFFKIKLKPSFLYKKTLSDSNSTIYNGSELMRDQDAKNLILKPPAQWLQPFDFKLNGNSNENYNNEESHVIDDYQFENFYLPDNSDYVNSTEYETNSNENYDDSNFDSDNMKISYIIANSSDSFQVVKATTESDSFISNDNYMTNYNSNEDTTSSYIDEILTTENLKENFIVGNTSVSLTTTSSTTGTTTTTILTTTSTSTSTSTTTTSTKTTSKSITSSTFTSTTTVSNNTNSKTYSITTRKLKSSYIKSKFLSLNYKTTVKLGYTTTVKNLISTRLYNISLERNLNKLNETFNIQLNNLSSFSSKLSIDDYFKCQRNLTKLTMFYTNSDKLICYQLAINKTLYKCSDDILEKKLVMKLGQYYLIQLKPLIVTKYKISCKNSSSFLQKELEPLTKPSSIYYNEKQSLICNFITKKASNRKKLVWKLYLILKNQTCIPYLVQLNKEKNNYINETLYLNEKDLKKKNKTNIDIDNKTASENYIFSTPSINSVNIDEYLNSDDEFIINQDSSLEINSSYFSGINKLVLIVLVACSICFILMANTLLFIIFKKKKKPDQPNNFSMSMSMNNRLLQNYLDLSVNSDAKSSSSTPKSVKNKKELTSTSSSSNNSKEILNKNNNCCDESITNEFLFKSKSMYPKKDILTHNLIDKKENNNTEELIDFKNIKKTCESNENNEEAKLVKKFTKSENHKYEESDQYNDDKNSNLEINRIPSIKKHKYSVSTIATQADMDKGSIMAERKDFKYRNQDHSDVESQILSIEVDLCSDVYASIADWYNLNNINPSTISKQNEKTNPYMDKFLSARKELASVTVNDYVAFQNCLNFQLQAAREAALATAQSNKNDLNNNNKYKIEFINPQKSANKTTEKDTKSSTNQKPTKNRMILRISSISSSRSSIIENKNKNNDNIEKTGLIPYTFSQKFDSKQLRKQPFFRLQTNNSETPLTKSTNSTTTELQNIIAYHAAFGSSDSFHSNSNLSQNSSTSGSNSSPANQSFPNNLYMYLDSVPHLKSYLNMHDSEIAKQYIEKLFKLGNSNDFLSQSSFLNAMAQQKNSSSQDSTNEKSDESFNKCYEINRAKTFSIKKFNQYDEDDGQDQKIYENDPNMIYTQVESSSNDEQDMNKISTSSSNPSSSRSSSSSNSSKTRSNSLTSSSSTSSIEIKKEETFNKPKANEKECLFLKKSSNLISSSDEIIKKEMISYNLDNNCTIKNEINSQTTTNSSSSQEDSPLKSSNFKKVNYLKDLFNKKAAISSSSSNIDHQPNKISIKNINNETTSVKQPSTFNSSPAKSSQQISQSDKNKIDLSNLPKAERIKIMLEQERKALDLAKKVHSSCSSIQSTPIKSLDDEKNFDNLIKPINQYDQNNIENNNLIDCDSSSSNANSTKNVRFSDNVSYI